MTINNETPLETVRNLIKNGEQDSALQILVKLVEKEPDNQMAFVILGGIYFNSGKNQTAEMIFKRLILMNPGCGEYSIALFNTLWKMDRKEEGLEEIKRFLKIADRDTEKKTIEQYMQITKDLTS